MPDNRREGLCRQGCCRVLRNNLSAILPLVAAVLAFAIGLPLGNEDMHEDVITWLELPGQLYLRTLLLIVLPLIVSCAINASSSMNIKSQGKVGGMILLYAVIMNLVGAGIGLALAAAFKLGQEDTEVSGVDPNKNFAQLTSQDAFADLIRNLFPDNIVAAAFRSTQTRYDQATVNGTVIQKRVVGTTERSNIIGLLVVSVALGVAANLLGTVAKPFLLFFEALQAITIKVMEWFMWTTFIGVFSLVLANLLKLDDPVASIKQLGMLCLALVIGCLVMMFVIFPVTILIGSKGNPFKFYPGMLQPWLTGIAPPASLAAYPHVLKSAENWGLDANNVNFTYPLVLITCRSGSAVFTAMASIMVASMAGITPTVSNYIVCLVLTTFLMAAMPGVPSGSFVVIIIILSSLGIPSEPVGLLFVTDWLLDRIRTGVNVLGQCTGVIVVDKLSAKGRAPADDVEKGKEQHEHEKHEKNEKEEKPAGPETTVVTNSSRAMLVTDEQEYTPM